MKTVLQSDEGRPVADYVRTLERAGTWLTSQQRSDGSSGDGLSLWAYYTQPMALRATGHPAAANRCLQHIKDKFLLEKGTMDVKRDGLEGIAYAPGWTVVNAHQWERFDISFPVSSWIVGLQDKETGAFYSTFDDAKRKKGLLEYEATIMGGHAMISTGRLENAQKVGDFLIKLHKSQPDIKNNYYFMWDKETGVQTDFDEKLAMFYVLDKHKDLQGYFNFGLSISLLARLYGATGKREYLKLAKDHFDFVDACRGTYNSALAHKLAWADAILYQMTGEEKFLRGAKKVGDYLIGVQKKDGRYHYKEIVPKFEDQPLTANLDIVSQFTTWIAQVRACLK
ncbi:MAG: hypothetical protein OK456_07825 [Thaumarchaeota archaeon]|nr:hypothetical protein [Nitrososphaerota archaeon]